MRAATQARASKRNVHSLKRKTWQFFLTILSVICIIFVASYSIIIDRAAVDNEVSQSEAALNSISKNLKVSLDRYKEMSRLIMLNANVVSFLRNTGNGSAYNTTKVVDGIFSITNIYSFVDSVYVYREDGEYVSTGAGVMLINERLLRSPDWKEPVLSAKGGNVTMINGNGAFQKKTGTPLITMGRMIYDIDKQVAIGSLYVHLTPSVLHAAARNMGINRAVCFLDEDGNVLGGDKSLGEYFKPEFVGRGFSAQKILVNSERKILSALSTEDIPIVMVSLSDVSGVGIESWEAVWIMVALLTAVVLSVFASGTFVSRNIARPIDMLTEAMTSTKENGELSEIHLSLPNNEIRRLANSYNSMIVHINHLIDELIEKEDSIRTAEMRTLQEQIKPHFLYNSLETISYMALQSDATQVHDALETLGSFYRNFLSKGSREIPLRNEILIVRDYLALQKLRYGDVFDDEYVVEERVLDTRIPKLILQPLVENSLYHGVRLKGEKGIIRIEGYERDDEVHICVYDTGVGMTPEQIAEVLSGAPFADKEALSGFGLKGTIERIRYYFNFRGVIEIRSELGEFTEIKIRIPKQR